VERIALALVPVIETLVKTVVCSTRALAALVEFLAALAISGGIGLITIAKGTGAFIDAIAY
jgi:hypothetical protein